MDLAEFFAGGKINKSEINEDGDLFIIQDERVAIVSAVMDNGNPLYLLPATSQISLFNNQRGPT